MPSSHLPTCIDEFSGEESVTLNPGQILAMWHGLPYPRARRGVRYCFVHLLVFILCSAWQVRKLWWKWPNGPPTLFSKNWNRWGIGAPHATTLARIFQRLDAERLDELAFL